MSSSKQLVAQRVRVHDLHEPSERCVDHKGAGCVRVYDADEVDALLRERAQSEPAAPASKQYAPRVDHQTIAKVIGGNATQSERDAVANYILGMERTIQSRVADEPPVAHDINSLSAMTIMRICNAYESGYGRGQSKRDLSQPYATGCPEAIAYYEGWISGIRSTAEPPLDARLQFERDVFNALIATGIYDRMNDRTPEDNADRIVDTLIAEVDPILSRYYNRRPAPTKQVPLCDCDEDTGCKEYAPAVFRCHKDERAATEKGECRCYATLRVPFCPVHGDKPTVEEPPYPSIEPVPCLCRPGQCLGVKPFSNVVCKAGAALETNERRGGCVDLDPDWPGVAGHPRGPRYCVLYPNCKCGRTAPSETRACLKCEAPLPPHWSFSYCDTCRDLR